MLHDQDLVSIQEVRSKIELAHAAWLEYRNFSQEQVDAVVEAMATAGRAHARPLAQLAVEETGYGNVDDKVAKNLLCADLLPRTIRGMKTVGVLREIPEQKITEIGVPVGVVAAILPTTNPTSTAIFKSIVSLKAGNAIVLSPHPRARRSTCETAAILEQAAVKAGAPQGLIQCVTTSTLEATNALMRHPKTAVILSTGGSGIVRAAYSSGKPAFGVGPGNVPVLLDTSADIPEAVRMIVNGKSFDYGTVCSSEQTVVAERSNRDRILSEMQARNAYLMNDQERQALERTLFKEGTQVSAQCVGQSPQKIAQMAGFTVPAETRILVAEIGGVGKEHPLSAEKLSPVLALLFVDSFQAAMDACEGILRFGGLGHTCVIFAQDQARVREYGVRMPAFRILVNTAAPQGSVGITTALQPSMTLGCGAMAGNGTSDNVGPQHLINVKRIAWLVRQPEEAFPSQNESQPVVANVTRAAISAAVEKYLSNRGIPAASPRSASLTATAGTAQAASGVTSAPPVAPKFPAASARAVVASIVDQFLSMKPGGLAPAAPACGCAARPAASGGGCCGVGQAVTTTATNAVSSASASPASSPLPPAPVIQIVDFVCENDVRAAINQSRKIYIGPRTIVTPAARELASPAEILVLAER